VYLAARPAGPLPPLGPFLDPAHGVWTVATTAALPRHAEAMVPGLGDTVVVVYDDRRVPHVFAASREDAAAAMGYVMARDRLFQLEMQTRATEGTLSEVLGSRVLGFDQVRRRRGLAWSARRQDAALEPGSEIARALDAYAAGVNAWIEGLGSTDLPLEYHLLAVRPKRWERVHSLYLLREMGTTLSFSTQERWVADVIERVGWDAARALFPAHAPIVEPIVPLPGERYPRFDDTPLPFPDLRGGMGREEAERGGRHASLSTSSSRPVPPPTADEGRGRAAWASNNWVVAPERSADGEALLAGDPHLGLTLPSIWYEAHLVVRGVQDVYGVTLPGSPASVIGFNRDVAWSFTNAQADLLDYYQEQVDDTLNPGRYLVDGAWRPLEVRVERYRNRSGRVMHTDTLYHTHRGPLVRWSGGRWVSLAWTIHEGGRGIGALLRAARAGSVPEWLRAMEEYDAVTQNGAVADRQGNIAILAAGRYPRRPAGVAGDTLLDGRTSAGDWQGGLDPAAYPRVVNPPQGYLASANQEPLDPRAYDRYLATDWPVPWRAMRINALLRSDSSVTLDEMQAYQTDPGSERAELFVGELIEIGGAAGAEQAGRRATPEVGPTSSSERGAAGVASRSARAAVLLAQWDRRYTKDNTRAVLFELTMSELQRRAWDELEGVRRPDEVALWRLLRDSASPWWDVRATAAVETRDEVVRASLAAALDTALARYGEPDSGGWRWDRIRHARIDHLLGLRSLSAWAVPVQGGSGTLNPSSGSGTHGASWRMVVQLGEGVAARSTYPGGQSGNPVSRYYDDRVAAWSEGQLEAVRLPRSPADLPPERVISTLLLRPGRAR
jgi:penicillin amidase